MSLQPRSLVFRLAAATLATLAMAAAARAQPDFSKAFEPDVIGPGSVTALRFDISNGDPVNPVANMAFTDTLPPGVTIAEPANVINSCGGSVTAPGGGSVISLSDGTLGASSDCVVSVDVTALFGDLYSNLSGDLTSSLGNSGGAAADLVVDTDRPGFGKSFSPASVNIGTRSALTFLIDNTASPENVTRLDFRDNLPRGMVVASPSNASTDCVSPAIPAVLTATPGSDFIGFTAEGADLEGFEVLPAGGICTVTVEVVATVAGPLDNVSDELTVVGAGFTLLSSGRASATLDVSATAVSLIKAFADDPVLPGDPVTLEFTVENRNRNTEASNISFSDTLDPLGLLVGLAPAEPLPKAACGGVLDFSAGALTFTGGGLPGGGSCTFSALLQVPPSAVSGQYPNTTGAVTAVVGGAGVVGAAARDTLFVETPPLLTKTFTGDPVAAGGNLTMEFSIMNGSATEMMTDIAFTDSLTAFIPGVLATVPPPGFCGPGSSMAVAAGFGEFFLEMTGGELAAGATCNFQVDLQLPTGIPGRIYTNTTGAPVGTVGGSTFSGDPATDSAVVVAAPRLLKEFLGDPVTPGATVTLQYSIAYNESAPGAATQISFTDNLDAALAGLSAVGLPIVDVCGAGSQLTGTGSLSLTGGSLAPNASCSFAVTLQVPAGAAPGQYLSESGNLTATVLGLGTIGSPATDVLDLSALTLAKSFLDGTVAAGDLTTLRFTLSNLSSESASDIGFTDDLDATLSGLVATGLPLPDPCGAGSQISGTGALAFTGGSLAPLSSCSFDVQLQVPGAAPPGEYRNQTSAVTAVLSGTGPTSSEAAFDSLFVVVPADLTISKIDSVDPVIAGTELTYAITVFNNGPGVAFDVVVIDTLPGGVTLLETVGCIGDPLGAPNCGLGAIAAGTSKSYTIRVLVDGSRVGVLTNVASVNSTTIDANPGDETSVETTAVAALADLAVQITDTPDPVAAGSEITYSLTAVNAGPSDATGVAVTADLPTGTRFVSSTVACAAADVTLTCPLGGLIAGGSRSFGLVIRVGEDLTGAVVLKPQVNSDQPDPSVGDNQAEAVTAIDTSTDLELRLSGAPDPALLGQPLQLRAEVENLGPATATAVQLRWRLPQGVALQSSSVFPRGACGSAADLVSCSLGSVRPGETFEVALDVTTLRSGTHLSSASLTAANRDPVPGNNERRLTIVVDPAADIALAKATDIEPALSQMQLEYRLEVTNNGPATATQLLLTDFLPVGVQLLEESLPDACQVATPEEGAARVECGLDALEPLASATIDFSVIVNQLRGEVTNRASVTAAETDPDTSNNDASVTNQVAMEGDLNGDGVVDLGDLAALIQELNDGDGEAVEDVSGGSFAGTALFDVNRDGLVNRQDIPPLMARILRR